MKHVIIIGGGIAGLTTAYCLKKAGFDVTLIERNSYVGGAIRTVFKHNRYLLELGPNTFLSNSDIIISLSRTLGVEGHLVSNPKAAQKRYLYRNKALHALPFGPKAFLRSPIMSYLGKARLLIEPLIRSKSPDHESLAAFVQRRAGKELLEALVDPFVSGVYAGDPYQLEVRSVFPRLIEIERECGSILMGMKRLRGNLGGNDLLSYCWGMETLPSRLYDMLKKSIRTDTGVETIEQPTDKKWLVRLDTYGETIEADAVVIATQASEAARLLVPHAAEIFKPLMGIPYVPMAVVHTAYGRRDIPVKMDGFGFLIPRREKVRLLGSIWSSSLFPNRAPQGEALLTSFIGGATDPHAINLDDHELLAHAGSGLEQTMGIRAEPHFHHITRIAQAIPQYTIGHAARLEAIADGTQKLPGIFLTGSYFRGISVADTIAHARETAYLIQSYLVSDR